MGAMKSTLIILAGAVIVFFVVWLIERWRLM